METSDCINGRASVRNYSPEPIPESVLKEILEAAIRAPSSGNIQDWEFIIVKTPEGRRALSSAAFNQGFVANAPVVIVVCSDINKIAKAYGERGKDLYSIQNTSSAIMNMMLLAWDKGLGTCWVGAFDESEVRDSVIIPENVRPVALITIGYPESKPTKTKRESVEGSIHWETL